MPKPKKHQGIEVKCIICGVCFRTWENNLKKGKGIYCSRACFAVIQRQRSSAMKGKKHTKEARRKMSEALKGRRCSPRTEFKKGHIPANFKGWRTHAKGYIWLHKPNHIYCDKMGYILEHRFVMEQHLGRFLSQKEIVHHINEDTSDNRIENLMLFSGTKTHLQHHALQRKLNQR